MSDVIAEINQTFKKNAVVDVKSGDTVRVHQRIKEGSKERIQVFQGLVIRVDRTNSHTSRITVRRLASGVGVEKSFLIHSPLITKIEIVKRSRVRRNYLSYMKSLTGKATRLSGVDFDREAANKIDEPEPEAEITEEVAVEVTPEVEVVAEIEPEEETKDADKTE